MSTCETLPPLQAYYSPTVRIHDPMCTCHSHPRNCVPFSCGSLMMLDSTAATEQIIIRERLITVTVSENSDTSFRFALRHLFREGGFNHINVYNSANLGQLCGRANRKNRTPQPQERVGESHQYISRLPQTWEEPCRSALQRSRTYRTRAAFPVCKNVGAYNARCKHTYTVTCKVSKWRFSSSMSS